jgi:DNA gyrase subunit B
MEEIRTPAEAVRNRPEMFIGDTTTGAGVYHMVLDVLATACDQHLAGRCSSIAIDVAADGTITIEDDGPGLPVHGSLGRPPLDVLLTRMAGLPATEGHRLHVHLGLGGIGLFVVNALSERFELVSIHDGIEARTIHARGEVVEPITTAPTERPSGTTIRFRPDPTIFHHPRVPRVALAQKLEDLAFLMPRLAVRWTIAGDDLAAGGLAARVALGVPCDLADVASHRASYQTACGPIDVEVALGWRTAPRDKDAAPALDSFVNLERTPDHGSHVEGLLDGIAAFLGGKPQLTDADGLVGIVALIAAQVTYDGPARARLDMPQARAPVVEATGAALVRWADVRSADAAALRDRKRARRVGSLSRPIPSRH